MLGLNIGSGQRRFDPSLGWVNIDAVVREPDQVPDRVCDVGKEPLPFEPGTADLCVLHQVYEHFGLGEGRDVIRECYRVLRPGGSLIVTVPDMRALAQRWLVHGIEDYIYMVNVYGAFQGQETDRHKWGYTARTLQYDLASAVLSDLNSWRRVGLFDFRNIPGAGIAKAWWVLGAECVK